jgi:hypothetical protein
VKACPEMKLCVEQNGLELYFVKCSVCDWEDLNVYETYKDAEKRMNILLGEPVSQ